MSVKKALLIGINYYNSPQNRLNGCINDVKNMKAALMAKFGYKESNIKMLTDDTTISDENHQPTTRNILKFLTELIADSANCDEIWIHYSGHGSRVRDMNGDEPRDASGQALDSIIVPVDIDQGPNNFITDDQLYSIIRKTACKGNTFTFWDSCNSGTVCDLPWTFDYMYDTQRFARSLIPTRVASMGQNVNIISMSGCKDPQYSNDAYANGVYGGAFTDALLEAISRNPGNTSILKIYQDVCIVMKERGYMDRPSEYIQKPFLSCMMNNPTNIMLRPGDPTAIKTAANSVIRTSAMRDILSRAANNDVSFPGPPSPHLAMRAFLVPPLPALSREQQSPTRSSLAGAAKMLFPMMQNNARHTAVSMNFI